MEVIVSGRHVEVTDAMKEYAESKIRAVLETKHKITSVRVVLNVEKTRHTAEIIVHGKGLDIEANYESYDMYESIDEVVDRIETQVKKHFDKKQDHHKGKGISEITIENEEEDDDIDLDEL